MNLFRSLFVLLLPVSLFAANCDNCVAVVDVGSSGSRVHLFQVDNKQNNLKVTERWSKKITPGLASLTPDAANVNTYLNSLLSGSGQTPSIPLYFYATGGMRFQSQALQNKFYSLVRRWFARQSVWSLVEARTIAGREEGVFGWLAVHQQLKEVSNSQSVGVIDVGGASVQVTFPLEHDIKNNTDLITRISMQSQKIALFSHSFLGLGQNEFSKQFYDFSPCFITNYHDNTSMGDSFACERRISKVMNYSHHVDTIVQPILSANKVTDWYVIGAPVELAKSQPFDNHKGVFTNQQLLKETNLKVCQQNWKLIHSRYPNNEFLHMNCLYPAYYYALMVHGYGIAAKENIHFLVNNANNDWTMGAAIRIAQGKDGAFKIAG